MTTFLKTLRGHISPAEKAASDYTTIPFELTAPASRLHVRYTYSARMTADKVHGGNVIDIGLLDPRGHDFPGGRGFRGWSGSARQEFTITPNDATPGYLPGPLPAGVYYVLLGLYRIWPEGADYQIDIEADLTDAYTAPIEDVESVQSAMPANVTPQRRLDREAPTMWLRGDLQSHTYHSDAKGSPEQLIAKAKALGFDFLAITDHNTVSHHAEFPSLASHGVLLLRGQEVTTYYGHMNVWGTSRWCDFRCRTSVDIERIIEFAHAHGGVCSINHPKTGGPAWEYGTDLNVQAMEVWQGPWPYRNSESFALWDRLLCAGWRVPAVGGSDYHCPSGEETSLLRLGQPTTWIRATECTEDAILSAICAGRSTISALPDGPRLDISASQREQQAEMGEALPISADMPVEVSVTIVDGAGYSLHLIADGKNVVQQDIGTDETKVSVEIGCKTYVRAELVRDMTDDRLPAQAPTDIDLRNWRWAASNPVYMSPR